MGFLGALAQGRIQAIDKKAQQEAQQQSQTFAAALGMANLQHLNAETKKLGEPTATDYTIRDPGDGSPLQRINKSTGETQPLMKSDGTPVMGTKKAPLLGTPEYLAAKGDETKITAQNQNKYGYHAPPSSFSFGTTVDANGQPVVLKQNTKTGEVTPTDALKPTTTGRGGGIGSLTPEAIQAMYDQAAHANSVMRAYEDDYRAGKVQVHTGSQALGAGAGAHSTGLMALATGAEAAGSNALMGVTDPRYQEYLTAQKRFGNIMGNLMSKRYSEYQGTLDTQLAGLSANDAAPTLDLKQSYRSDLLNNRPSGPKAKGATPTSRTGGPSGDINLAGDIHAGGKPSITSQEQYDAAIAAGHPDSVISHLYTIPSTIRRKK